MAQKKQSRGHEGGRRRLRLRRGWREDRVAIAATCVFSTVRPNGHHNSGRKRWRKKCGAGKICCASSSSSSSGVCGVFYTEIELQPPLPVSVNTCPGPTGQESETCDKQCPCTRSEESLPRKGVTDGAWPWRGCNKASCHRSYSSSKEDWDMRRPSIAGATPIDRRI